MKNIANSAERDRITLSNDRERVFNILRERKPDALKIGPYVRRGETLCVQVPTTWAQQRLWFLDHLHGESAAYHIPLAARIQGPLNEAALQKALDTLVQRHEVLRTVFVNVEGEARQEIAAGGSFLLKVTDISGLERAHQDELVQIEKTEEARRRLDLYKGPLIRGRLIRLTPEEHVLLISMHHIVSDGWSIDVFTRELAEVYSAYWDGRDNPLNALPIQYGDYALWQREWAQKEDFDLQMRYWRATLEHAAPQLELPTDYARPTIQSYRGRDVGLVLCTQLTSRLRALAHDRDMTLFMVLSAAWSILLSRLSGQEDVLIGTPVANRRSPELEGLIGFFVNTLVLRFCVRGDLRIEELLEHVKEVALGAYDHQDAPFEKVVEELQPQRTLARNPLFQVMFAFQNTPPSRLLLPGVTVTSEEVVEETSKFDLLLSLQDRGSEITGTLNYATDLFDRQTVDRWIGYFTVVLEGLVDGTQSRRVYELPIMPERERIQVIDAFNSTHVAYPKEKLIHELFEEQVARTPDAVAVVFESDSLTYAMLNGKANQLARYLRIQGIGPDQRVGICVERSLDLVVGLMAILKAGGAYVPLDPNYPAERLVHMLSDAAPKVLLSQERLRGKLPQTDAQLILLDADWGEVAGEPADNLNPKFLGLHPYHLAYVIFTSGSTGQPKGAMNEHRGVVNRLQWMQDAYQLGVEDRVLQKTPVSFDVSVWEFFWTLASGAQLIVARPEGHKDPSYLRSLIEETGVTTVHFVPSMLQSFLDQHASGQCLNLRHVVCSGEELPATLQRKFFESFPQVRLSNLYGPTEAAVDVTAWECRADDTSTRVPIGRPISNIRIYVLDRYGQPVPVGVVGEIYIGGVGVGRGYLNRPELTTDRFIKDPFSAEPKTRIYKTGDLGRWRSDGSIDYLGRNDHQVKIRGFRIELGEIEAQLIRHPQVKESAVIVREDVPGEKRLVAYVTTEGPFTVDAIPSAEKLRMHLKAVLPEYMVPNAFVMLEQLPLTSNGKLDRQALPEPDLGSYVSRQYEEPQGAVEVVLADIWQAILRVKRIGRQDNFFELGGHSLLIVQMLERLRRVGLSAEVRRVFESPTLADLARELTYQTAGQFDVPPNLIPPGCEAITAQMLPLVELETHHIERIVQTVPGGAVNIQDIYPLAPLQEGILFHHLLDELAGDVYVMSIVLSVCSQERLEQLISALQEVINRHDVLRTGVLWEQLPRPVQVVFRKATLPVEVIAMDLDRDSKEQIGDWIKPERQRLDLRQAPLLRIKVAADPHDKKWYALLHLHHIVCDHEAVATMFAEVVACLADRAQELPKPIPYRNHVAQALAYSRMHDAEEFFRSKLGDVDEPTAPFGLLDVHGDGSRIQEDRQVLEPELARRLRIQASRLGVSAATLFHAIWSLVVSRTSGRDDVVFGSVLLGRLQGSAGAQRTLGMFINTLPLRLRLNDMTAVALIEQTQRELIELLSYEQAPLAVAQRCSGIVGSEPLFSTLFNYRHSVLDLRGELGNAAGVTVLATRGWTNYPIEFVVDDLSDGFALTANTDRSIGPGRILEYMHTATRSLVDALESASQTPVLSLAVLPASERRRIIQQFNATQVSYPKGKLIHELFEDQVERTPEAIAVVYEGQPLTYGEVNGRANQLARHLVSQGVGPNRLVGLLVERSAEMVIGLLGVLKAGGAYVPLDPNYPPARLQHMMKDASPCVLLIQERLRELLPESAAAVIALDNDWRAIAQQSPATPDSKARGLRTDHLAYVIYTSGSTGNPKGAMNEHRGVVNRLQWMQDQYKLSDQDRVLQKTPFSFDVSVWEFFWTLLNGARLIIARPEGHKDPDYLRKLIEDAGITTLHFVPSMLQTFLEHHPPGACPSLRHVVCSGEELSAALQRKYFESLPQASLSNLYGPTEAAVDVTAWECEHRNQGARVPIGRPISNIQMYLLDRHAQPVPLGIAGEMYIGGVGVGRGYLNRPALTAERFLPNPFSADPKERLYKTGDLGRWRPDGTIEYLGRNDNQVKIRGFRIEPGEIEAQLALHWQVKDVVVIAREDNPGEKRLVSYVVPDLLLLKGLGYQDPEKAATEVVDQWKELYEETYSLASLAPSFVGWNSSYTGQPIPEEQMREWLQCTLDRLVELRPRRVLEIGCGVGLLLAHLAPCCEVYRGTDFSTEAIERLRSWVSTRTQLQHVQLEQCSALELEQHEPSGYDTVILNSVVQYFPDIDYLYAVLKRAMSWLPAGGRIFLGDVRHLGLLRVFHTSVQLERATAVVSTAELKSRIARAIEQEKELVIDPLYFEQLREQLPGIDGVQILLKRGRSDNELTRYRYDVILQVGNPSNSVDQDWIDWRPGRSSVAEITSLMRAQYPSALRIRGVPNARLGRDLAAARLIDAAPDSLTVEKLRYTLSQIEIGGEDPQLFWELGEAQGYETTVCWNGERDDGAFDVVVIGKTSAAVEMHTVHVKGSQRIAAKKTQGESYANDPRGYRLKQELIPRLREYLNDTLPPHMVPSAFVVLDSFPLTPNGKLDRLALPAPEFGFHSSGRYQAPQGEIEEALAGIWQVLLRTERIGRPDNFFELGGHSLLAIRMLSQVNHSLRSQLTVLDVYNNPTIRELANRISGKITSDDFVDLRQEAVLGEEIVVQPGIPRFPENTMMLTGCTGFVGRFLLAELIHETDATIYCLVRARTPQLAFSRIKTILSTWDLWRDGFERRIVAIAGDLSLPRLGIDGDTYRDLCQRVDTIYHCGTSMSHLETYAMAKAANVDGARGLIKLATAGRPKRINYISTLGIFSALGAGATRVVDEATPIDQEKHLISSGYVASKWVGERMFMTANERGIPCNIFRLGLIWADTQQGRYDELQREDRIFRSCLLSGFGIADYRYEVAPTPVDQAARAVVYLGARHSDGQGIFHISSSDQVVEHVFERCNEIAHTSLELKPLYQWICEIKRLHRLGHSLPAVPLIEFAFSMDEASFVAHQRAQAGHIHYKCTRTRLELAAAGLAMPGVNDVLLKAYLGNLVSRDVELQQRTVSRG